MSGKDMFRLLTSGIAFKKETSVVRRGSTKTTDPSTSSSVHDVEGVSDLVTGNGIGRFRRKNRIHVSGTDVCSPIDDWNLLRQQGMKDELVDVIAAKYLKPTPIQMQAIPLLMEGREVLACAPTGSGKTAAYLIPLIHHLAASTKPRGRNVRAVVLCPTRELAQQIYRECVALGSGVGCKSFVLEKVNAATVAKLNSGSVDVLVSVPNRLVYMLKDNVLRLDKVEWMIVDEADKLFEAGENGFRDQLAAVYRSCSSGSVTVRRVMFSATVAPDVEEWCRLNLDNLCAVTVGGRNAAAKTVRQKLVYAGNEKGKLEAFRQLVQTGQLVPPVLVFVQTKQRAKELHEQLTKDGGGGGGANLYVDVIHSDRSELQRESSVRAFRSGQVWVLICTELMGRGIDFKGVNLVVNYDFPPSAVSYVHRIGRTGRAGRPGEAITFFTNDDKSLLRSVAHLVKASGSHVPDYMLHMKKPTQQEKRKLARRGLKREPISKESKYDKERRERLEAMIRKSKKLKRKLPREAGEEKSDE